MTAGENLKGHPRAKHVIGRYESDPEAQGVIRPENNAWQLVIDKDGFPHLYLQVKVGEGQTGLLAIEDVLPDGLSVRDLMEGEFTGTLSPEEEAKAVEEYNALHESRPIPCPRV